MSQLSEEALHILQHSLGVDQYGRGEQYRRHFVTGQGSVDYPTCLALVDAGLMVRDRSSPLTGGDDLFLVTSEGKVFVAEHSPSPPKLTRNQQRYQEYLNLDTGVPFGEYLKWKQAAYA